MHCFVRRCVELRGRCYGDVMLSEERHQAIVSAIRRAGAVTVAELSSRLDVSEATIRRDLDLLAGEGALRRRSVEHTSELQSRGHLVCRLLLAATKLPRHHPVASDPMLL